MAVLVVLVMVARRIGWKGQGMTLVLFGLGQAVRERIWFGKVIAALEFAPGTVPILVASGAFPPAVADSTLAMPKSSNFTTPSPQSRCQADFAPGAHDSGTKAAITSQRPLIWPSPSSAYGA